MGFIKNMFKDLVDASAVNDRNDDYDDSYEYYGEEEDEEEEYEEDERESPAVERMHTTKVYDRGNKVVSIHTTAQLQVVIVRPQKFDEVAGIADHLIEKRTIVLNLEQTDKNISRRIVDFLSGAAYAHRGKLKRIANNTYIITPFNVGLVGADVIGELENSGVFF